jgi:hypothetical protein
MFGDATKPSTMVDAGAVRGENVDAVDAQDAQLLPSGTRVEVRNRLVGDWSRGFEVIDATPDGYRLRRLSDGNELPLAMPHDDVRRERRRSGTWWM